MVSRQSNTNCWAIILFDIRHSVTVKSYNVTVLVNGTDFTLCVCVRVLWLGGQVNTKKLLDREVEDVYHVIIMAEDGGRPSLSTTTTVIIHVDDVNDNTPYFTFPSVVWFLLPSILLVFPLSPFTV